MKIESLRIRKEMKVFDLVEAFTLSAFNARRLGDSAKLWKRMIEDDAFIFFTFAGAMIPAGMREIISGTIELGFAHSIVTTGANIVHEICESLGYSHEIGSEKANDPELAERDLNRIYDVFIPTSAFFAVEEFLSKVFGEISGNLSSYEILWEIGSKLENSFLRVAFEKRVPVFCPTFHDSIAGLHLMLYGKKVVLDYKKDIKKILELCSQNRKMGIIIVGGGVPKNFALQSMLLSKGFDYAIQITTDSPHFGGLSGATLEEAKSWCKIKKDAKVVTIYCDATITLPILFAYLVDSI
ncbi:MAG: deoxyhypusine synthase [Archaeoglobaceae archaeon]|nr:deoxyhypusine synthase [Archaeoglobaceae archaeon]MDW7990283.1 deoxyhypusine synthase [Archaeoglobaceae archaeon]